MAKFNLDDYETVEVRIRRFYEAHPDGRIITVNQTTPQDRDRKTWVVAAMVFLSAEDQMAGLPKASGLAFEMDGSGMANQTSALENCETSAIGRALANANFSGNKRTSREEMEKVERGISPVQQPVTSNSIDYNDALAKMTTKAEARTLWISANKANAGKEILDKISKLAQELPD